MNANTTEDKRELQALDVCNRHLRDSVKTRLVRKCYKKRVTIRCTAGYYYTLAKQQNISVHNLKNTQRLCALNTNVQKFSYIRVCVSCPNNLSREQLQLFVNYRHLADN